MEEALTAIAAKTQPGRQVRIVSPSQRPSAPTASSTP
jgi:hypothetical protein